MATNNTNTSAQHEFDMYSFAAHDTALYLDTHPDDALALEFFAQYNNLAREAHNRIPPEQRPITQDDLPHGAGNGWAWVTGKWPWE